MVTFVLFYNCVKLNWAYFNECVQFRIYFCKITIFSAIIRMCFKLKQEEKYEGCCNCSL
ncbi:hypothetical protein CLOSBL3_11884 [Clostridiaceae bacterium BL-3]|nr:hypothetical protein CLOSBL3_11884 [Clostridiaceae bacterium BL-3]